MSAPRCLIFAIALCLASACDSKQGKAIPSISSLQWQCRGGGGVRQCVIKNSLPQAYGPFDVEFQAFDERGRTLGGPSTVSIPGLGPRQDHEFTLVSSPQTRRVNLVRVIPK